MALELSIQTEKILNVGETVRFVDTSSWSVETPRESIAVFVVALFKDVLGESSISVDNTAPTTAVSWDIPTPKDGGITIKTVGFKVLVESVEPIIRTDGEVVWDTGSQTLKKWVTDEWVDTTLEEAIAADVYNYASVLGQIPILFRAYQYRNKINLKYIENFESHRFSKQKDNLIALKEPLDYSHALIHGAEYNWSMENYTGYYNIVDTLNKLIESNSN